MGSPLESYESGYDRATGGWSVGDGGLDWGSVEMEVGRLIRSLVVLSRPGVVLETGTYQGYSTSCIASGLEACGGGLVYTVDPSPRSRYGVGRRWSVT